MEYFIRLIVAAITVLVACDNSYASIRSEFDEIVRERNACNKIDEHFLGEYGDKFSLAVKNGGDVEVVDAIENVREIQRSFNECWSFYGIAVMSLYDGEVKFNVVPAAIKHIECVREKLAKRFSEMIFAAEKYKDERLRSMMLQLLSESKREFLLVDRCLGLLTKY